MDAFDNPARGGMAGSQRDGAPTDQTNQAVGGSEFLAAAAKVTAALHEPLRGLALASM